MKKIILPLIALACGWAFSGRADTTYIINNASADAFLATGSPNNPVGANLTSLNFGGAGTLAIAPASSTKGEFDSIVQFNSAAAVSQFNSFYGVGGWTITSLTLSLASNFPIQGSQPNNAIFNTINAGNFNITWLGYNGWTEGSGGGMGEPGYPNNNEVSFNSKTTLFSAGSDALGTYGYTPPGNSGYLNYALPLDSSLVANAAAGGPLSLYFSAATNSSVGYLFNSRSFANNHPEFTITAAAVPEATNTALLLSFPALGLALRRFKKN